MTQWRVGSFLGHGRTKLVVQASILTILGGALVFVALVPVVPIFASNGKRDDCYDKDGDSDEGRRKGWIHSIRRFRFLGLDYTLHRVADTLSTEVFDTDEVQINDTLLFVDERCFLL
jgi:hypothetical protein